MHALQLLDVPLCTSTLFMSDENVEQSFRKMPRSTQCLHVYGRVIPSDDEFVQQREQPFTIFIENRLTHDKHVAEGRFAPVQHGIGIDCIVGMPLDKHVVHMA